MKKIWLAILITALIPMVASAAKVKIGEELPSVTIRGNDDQGMIEIKGDGFEKKTWKSTMLKDNGKVYGVLHIAGTSSAKEINQEFVDALKAAQFPAETYQTCSIINLDDAIWGTSGIVEGKVEDNKKNSPMAMFVLDEGGKVREEWGLEKDSYAVIILDKQGKVLKFKEGKLNKAEIKEFLDVIKANM